MNTPTFYTLGTAAKALGVTKPTVRKWIDDGELPASRNDKGHFQIQRPDLERLYPEKLHEVETRHQVTSEDLHPLPPKNDGALQVVDTAYQETIKTLNKLIDEKERARVEAEKNAEHWRTEYRSTQKQLTDQRTEAEKIKAKLVDVEQAPKPVIRRRPLTLKERLFGGTISEVEEVA